MVRAKIFSVGDDQRLSLLETTKDCLCWRRPEKISVVRRPEKISVGDDQRLSLLETTEKIVSLGDDQRLSLLETTRDFLCWRRPEIFSVEADQS